MWNSNDRFLRFPNYFRSASDPHERTCSLAIDGLSIALTMVRKDGWRVQAISKMKIIAGHARGRKLKAPRGLTTRPATARIRESIFSRLLVRLDFDGLRCSIFSPAAAPSASRRSRAAPRTRPSSIPRKRRPLSSAKTSRRSGSAIAHASSAIDLRRALPELSQRRKILRAGFHRCALRRRHQQSGDADAGGVAPRRAMADGW